ncbi:tripartite tricarboxylate transporter TctB family protein [Microbacterium sp.]|uniref:tripartite tricarboxylate transporter TctB family protein n=1 Tax=Microbacterium sp. TaxID=51671 RepID=UPI00281130A9|nr:tripartite tricarboxylate transporter TctB family protein [Microbacterium sp.]
MTARTARVAASAALAVLGVVAALMGAGYGFTKEDGQVGAGFMPVVLGVVMTVLAVLDVLATLRRPVAARAVDADDSDIDVLGRSQHQRNRMLAMVIGMLVVALLLVPVTGLLVALGLLVVGIAALVERRHIAVALLVGVIAVAVVHVVFAVLLKVPMPTGLIGFI